MDAIVRNDGDGQDRAHRARVTLRAAGAAILAASVTMPLAVLPMVSAVHGSAGLDLLIRDHLSALLVVAMAGALVGAALLIQAASELPSAAEQRASATTTHFGRFLEAPVNRLLKLAGACSGLLILGTLVSGWNGFFPALIVGAVAAAVWGWPLWWLWRTGKPAAALRAVRTWPGWSSPMSYLFPSRVHVVRFVAVLVVAIGCWHYFLRDRLADYGEDKGVPLPALYILAEAISGRDAPCSYIPRDRRERIHCDRMMAVNRSYAAGKADIATRSREIAGIRYHLADSPGGTAVLDEYVRRLAERP